MQTWVAAISASLCLLASGPAHCTGGQPAPRADPYGIWASKYNELFIVRRNGTYTYCNAVRCEDGRYTEQGPTRVVLFDFANLKTSEHLRQGSGWQAGYDIDSDYVLVISDFEASDSYRPPYCEDRPCFLVGPEDQGSAVPFFKVFASSE